MKKTVSVICVFILIIALCACGSGSNSTSSTYVLIDGQKQSVDYFNTINDLQIDDLQTKTITVAAKLEEVHGSTYFQQLAYDVDSYLELDGGGFKNFYVETSGHEDVIKMWSNGDMIEVTGVIYIFNEVNFFKKWQQYGSGAMTVKNLRTGESFSINDN